jgi:hypothetical protein
LLGANFGYSQRQTRLAFQEKPMKKIEQLSMAVVLTVMLTMSTLAGDIHIPAPAPPPPSSSVAAAPGEIPNPGDVHVPGAPSDSVAEVALDLLLSVMSAF